MSRFAYRMAIGNNPQGKQKLYFCCHPDDFELHFAGISDDVFSCSENCVLYYEQEPDAPYDPEELEAALSQMRALVIVVTRRFLTQPSRALDVELPIAQRHGIPLIPIAFDVDYDDLYQEKLGSVQYLEKGNLDPTAIRYEDKLKKLLGALLVGEEEERRIREEFAGRIFMSYRKKDRAHAQDVMRAIHDVDLCRDVAIWYDEFLVPGEDYNDAIRDELRESDVFALTVTPSLLEPGNYVAEHEFPDAVEAGKPIVPIEAVPTAGLDGRSESAEDKPPESAPAGEASGAPAGESPGADAGEASGADAEKKPKGLFAKLASEGLFGRKKASKDASAGKADKQPKDAFAGLGPTVGVADGNAVGERLRHAFVEEAGRDDLLVHNDEGDHVYRIGLAYKNGIDVMPDADKAVHLLEQASAEVPKAHYVLGKMHELGDGIPRDDDEAIREYELFIESMKDRLGVDYDDDVLVIDAWQAKADIEIRLGRYLSANETLAAEAQAIQKLADHYGEENRVYLVSCNERLGDVCAALGDVNGGIAAHAEQFRVLADFPEEYTAPFQINCLGRLGDLYAQRGEPKSAQWCYDYIGQLLDQVPPGDEDANTLYARATYRERLGDLMLNQGQALEALNNYVAARKDYVMVAFYADSRQARLSVAVESGKIGSVYSAAGLHERAEAEFLDAYNAKKELADDDGSVRELRSLSVTCSQLGHLYQDWGKLDEAERYFREDLALSERIIAIADTPAARADLENSREALTWVVLMRYAE